MVQVGLFHCHTSLFSKQSDFSQITQVGLVIHKGSSGQKQDALIIHKVLDIRTCFSVYGLSSPTRASESIVREKSRCRSWYVYEVKDKVGGTGQWKGCDVSQADPPLTHGGTPHQTLSLPFIFSSVEWGQ